MAQPVVYLLNSPHHVTYFAAYVPGASEGCAGNWDLENSYSLPQAHVLIGKLCQRFVETRNILLIVLTPRPC